MSRANHTPGPWSLWTGNSWRRFGSEATGMPVVEPFKNLRDGHPDLAVSDADARLIEAAPDMLEALEGVVRIADRKTVEFDAARAAIAKAKGETP